MTPSEFARDLLAVGGAAALIFIVAKKLSKRGGDDAPIRVKGGSVTIANKDDDWETDDEEGHEYHYKAQVKKVKVRAWESEKDFEDKKEPQLKCDGRKVELTVRRSDLPNDYYIVTFRANGALRVRDPAGELVALDDTLKDSHPNHWPELIVVTAGGFETGRYKFGTKTGFFVMKPVK